MIQNSGKGKLNGLDGENCVMNLEVSAVFVYLYYVHKHITLKFHTTDGSLNF